MSDAAMELFDAIEDYVARAVSPLLARIAELESRSLLVGPRGESGPAGINGKDGAPGKDADVDYDRIGNVIALAVEKEVGKFPIPRDGRDGKDGRDGVDGKDGAPGRDADADVIVERVLAAIPKPEDGKDGAPGLRGEKGADGRDGERGPQGERGDKGESGINGKDGSDGRDGRDAEVDYTKVLQGCADLIRQQVAALPTPRDGVDGKDGTPGRDADEAAIVKRVLEVIPTPRDGIDGKDGPKGDSGRDGRDGLPGVPGAHGEKGIDGKDGMDGFSPDNLEIEWNDDDDALVVRLLANDRVVERKARLPIPRDADIYVKGKTYQKGQIVTYGGSAFIARRDTSALIGGDPPSPDWRLFVKRGRDA